jgi:cyclophilin family peptidyl-prolyl cis-trans isomerase
MFHWTARGASLVGRKTTTMATEAMTRRRARRDQRPRLEGLESRAVPASLAPIPNITVPQFLGYQVPLEGGSGNPQSFTVTSDNPAIGASVAQGQFLTINVAHASSGANDPAFTGALTFQLFGDLTPQTVGKITQLVQQGFYTGKNFHRIASGFPDNDFIVQGGSVNGNGTGEVNQPGFPFGDEFNTQLAFTGNGLTTDPNSIYSVAGQLAMANAGPDTNGSQFFITTGDPRFLDFKHTIFGQLVSGQQTLVQMTQVARSGETPTSPILISSAVLSGASPDGVVHINAGQAVVNQKANVTVTATDLVDGSTTSQTFQVTIAANSSSERPFLGPVTNQVVGVTQTTPTIQGQTAVFQVPFTSPIPNTPVAFTVRGGVSGGSFTNVTNATATVDSSGVVRVVPNAGFTGVINLLVGVRNASATDTVASYDTQAITLTVLNGAPVNLPPIALDGSSTAATGSPSTIQLRGDTANPASSQTLTYTITSPPQNGTISGFNASTGLLTYTPKPGFLGTDTLQFRVRDVGAPTPNLDSTVATQTITVGGGATGAVRLIGNVLVVTPPPRSDSVPNTITVDQVGLDVRVTVNGALDSIQPSFQDLDRIVVYGTKASDTITVTNAVLVPTTLSGGSGGDNTIQAGGAPSLIHGWSGRTSATGGPRSDYIVGRLGALRARQSGGDDIVYGGTPRRGSSLTRPGQRPGGQFFKFNAQGRLVPVSVNQLFPRPRPIPTGRS